MKKLITAFAALAICFVQTAISQDIRLRFTGATTDSNYVQLDSVIVQNISRSWSETLVYPDTVLTLAQTGIAEARGLGAELSVYPNPFNGTTNVSVTMPQRDNAVLQVFNLAGQKIVERSLELEAGNNIFEVRLQNPQVYLLAVTTPQGRSSVKLLNRNAGEENGMFLRGNVVEKRRTSNPFQIRDVLKIVGYATNNGTALSSREVLQPQTASENITLFFTMSAPTFVIPTVTTDTVSGITDTSAVSGGNVTSDGGAAVTARGVCWSTSHNPTLSDSHTADGTGTGSFTSNITGLTATNTYYVRAYATNSVGTAYGNEITVTTVAGLPTVTTTTVSGITDTSAVSGGNVTSDGGAAVTARGVCWSTSHNPTLSDSHTADGTGTGSFTSNITGLTAATTYYVRAYATNTAGTAYGTEDTITTLPAGALPCTFSIGNNRQVRFSKGNLQYTTTGTHAVAGGGTAPGTWRFATNQWDTIGAANSNTSSPYTGWIDLFGWGTSGWNSGANAYQPYSTSASYTDYYPGGSYTNNLTGAYANADWGVYNAISNGGNQPEMWRTLTVAEGDTLINIRTTTSGIRYAKATVNGVPGLIIVPDNWSASIYALDSTNTGNATYTSNIIPSQQWPTLENAGCAFLPAAGYRSGSTVSCVGSGGFYWSATCGGSDVAPGPFFFRAVLGTNYYLGCSFRYNGHSVRLVKDIASDTTATTTTIPTVTTTAASNITATSAVSGGNVTSDGGAAVSARGVCWSTSHNPTISDSHTADGTGTGSFTSNITGLTAATTYYVRAYATNTAGTAYGSEDTITTIATTPHGGVLPGLFSVAANKQVLFSPGNLQWSKTGGGSSATTHTVAGGGTATGTWRFAPHQWDTIGAANSNISSSYSGWIDLFGWGTSGYNYKYPYMTSTTSSDYGNGNNDISNTKYDWGVYNSIYNPNTQTVESPGTYRCLTTSEWTYIFEYRSTSSGIRYAQGLVNGVAGLIIVPDNWNSSTYILNNTNSSGASYSSNVISVADWLILENAGAVFLPAAGSRNGTSIYYMGISGQYWTGTRYLSDYAYGAVFTNNAVTGGSIQDSRYLGRSVRLVKDTIPPVLPTVTTTAASNITDYSATSGGNVTSDGGSAVIARGVCWSTSQNPTLSNSHTSNGTGTGSFTSSLTGLTAETTYYVRAYAINSVDTAYGNQITFTTTGSYTFSVSDTTSVVFSPGNLQWSAKNGGSTATTHTVEGGGTAAGTWRFAPNQWDTIGTANSLISDTNSGWIDLFATNSR